MQPFWRLGKNHREYVAPALALLAVAALFVFFPQSDLSGNYPEAEEISGKDYEFQDYAEYFRKLAEDKGGAYAYQVLLRATLRSGTDIHLVAHIVGDVLYKQEGVEGIYTCTQDFRNACSHSVVIGVLNEFGEGALPEIAETCRKAPGGKGAYTMCFHGLGHGVLAFNGYKYDQAVAMCAKTGTEEYKNREYIECVGGMTMEMIAGVHDRAVWEKEYPNYFKKEDPLYPCDAPFMPKEVQPICYVHLTPRLFMAAGADLSAPDPKIFPIAFSYCDALPEDDAQNRMSCYGGFGKEFTVLAQGRDVRDIGKMQAPALTQVRDWCALAGNADGIRHCNNYALGSLFWGGENTPDASFTFCSLAEDEQQDACYQELVGHIRFYLGGESKGTELCSRLPEAYRAMCTSS